MTPFHGKQFTEHCTAVYNMSSIALLLTKQTNHMPSFLAQHFATRQAYQQNAYIYDTTSPCLVNCQSLARHHLGGLLGPVEQMSKLLLLLPS